MADPRLSTQVDGIDARFVSVKIDDSTITYSATAAGGSAQVGLAVRLVPGTAQTIELVGDAEAVFGKLIQVQADGVATVQYAGGMTLPGGASATLTIGSQIVGDLGAASAEGYIRSVDAATLAEVAVARGAIFDAGTTTAVEIIL
jgi:hypothetical protein